MYAETKKLCASSSNLVNMLTIIKWMNPIDFGGKVTMWK